MDINKIFKIGLLILGTIFLILYYCNSLNGRYQATMDGLNLIILDTHKGIVYGWSTKDNKWVILNPVKDYLQIK